VPRANQKVIALLLVVFCIAGKMGYAQRASAHSSALMRTAAVNHETLGVCMSGGSTLPLECYQPTTRLMIELGDLGSQGDLIAHAREQTLDILTTANTCTAWFEEIEPDVADVFRSLHYAIDAGGTAEIHSSRDVFGDLYFMHPWGAKAVENSGRDAFIQFNGNGPFFIARTHVAPANAPASDFRIEAPQPVYIGPYVGASTEARLTIMLHELGHIVGRLPKDDISWNGQSSENTRQVLRHCKKEIHEIARRGQ
jgi:hypothetical protein